MAVEHRRLLLNASVDRRIEVLVWSQFNVPSDYDVSLVRQTNSDIRGYDNLPVTFSHKGSRPLSVSHLQGCNTLARLEKFDISKDPQAIYCLTIVRRGAIPLPRRRP